MNIFLSFGSSACINATGASKVTLSLPSCALTTRVANNASSDIVGDATVSQSFRYLRCLLPSTYVLPLMHPSILSLIKITTSIVLVIFYSYVNNVGSIG